MNLKLLAAGAATAALALAGCGSDDTESGERAKPPGNGADRAFVADMIPHHQSAVEMAEIARERGASQFVKKLAGDIIRTQNAEISTMREQDAQLAGAAIKPGSLGVPDHMKGMNDDPQALRSAQPFDRAFIEMMIPHHQGAIEMARAELANGKDPELTALAQQIIDAQEREIREMRKHLDDPDAGSGGHGTDHSG
jgi:uncharacterized protein (DUF305 family)